MKGQEQLEVFVDIRDDIWLKVLPRNDWHTKVCEIADAVFSYTKREASEFSIAFMNDAQIQSLNSQFRGKNKPTNVLSFPCDEANYLGDIAIAFETVQSEALSQSKPLINHIKHMIVHGILHLLGYDHENDHDAQVMEDIEKKVLQHFHIKDPYL